MKEKVYRKFLEIKTLENLVEVKKPSDSYSVNLTSPKDFQLNKFFYKNIGKKYQWNDRLVWSCLLYTSPSPRDAHESRMPSSA